ncbi:MAG: biotin/lipoyl-binding protein [Nitrospirales bacterium]|nr:HlyD family efflux transporter periplasmic adaptor subunit [Nitrospira sp.]MDR4503108.1 biotin/lipoyl-binding protein [Nitrospirales bacterium]
MRNEEHRPTAHLGTTTELLEPTENAPPLSAKADTAAPPPTSTSGLASLEFQALFTLLQLEPQARMAQSIKELHFLAVNETRRLLPYRQAFLFKAGANLKSRCQLETASSVPAIRRDAPLTLWLEQTLHALRQKEGVPEKQLFSADECPPDLKNGWKEFSFPHVLWCPFILPDKTFLGGLWLAKDTPWQDSEATIAQRLCDTYAHAWGAMARRKRISLTQRTSRKWLWLALFTGLIAMAIPVRLSTLAPVEIVAREPAIVSAPMDGMIAEILVPPNTRVGKGQVIFQYDDTDLRSQYEVSEHNLTKAIAEYRKVTQQAFAAAESDAQVPLLRAEVQLQETERDYALERLEHVAVKATQTGLLLYSDQSDWVGRPIKTGERIMEIADPEKIELKIDVPVNDAIALQDRAAIEIFLDAKPLDTYPATLIRASYQAVELPEHILAYRVIAKFHHRPSDVRIGWRGTAKIYGDQTTVFFLVFRRPLSAIRQYLGW